MSYTVRELPKARADKHAIFSWIRERSPTGATAWLAAYDKAVEQLERRAESFGVALENPDVELEIRQILFKTRRGRVYRAIFFVDRRDVYVLRVRGPGQAPVEADEMR